MKHCTCRADNRDTSCRRFFISINYNFIRSEFPQTPMPVTMKLLQPLIVYPCTRRVEHPCRYAASLAPSQLPLSLRVECASLSKVCYNIKQIQCRPTNSTILLLENSTCVYYVERKQNFYELWVEHMKARCVRLLKYHQIYIICRLQ